jgi:membrane-bound lytic murein transglycosylase F
MLRPISLLSLVVLLTTAACERETYPEPIERDFDAIVERDTLVAVMQYNSTSYFLYRGLPMGFEYDLLRAFATEHDLTLRVHLVNSPDSLLPALLRGYGDVMAARVMPEAIDPDAPIAFTSSLYETRPAVVQAHGRRDIPRAVEKTITEGQDAAADAQADHDPDIARHEIPTNVELRVRRIQAPVDLAGETVHLPEGSPHRARLIEISDHLTGGIHVVEVDGGTAEGLIEQVAYHEVDLTVIGEDLANLRADAFTNVTVHPTLGEPQQVAWAVRPNSPQLLEALNTWLQAPEQKELIEGLFVRYYVDRKGYRERLESQYLTSETGTLSPYDDLFREHAPEADWDWRLLASLAYQESRFIPSARSWAGASGLLQLMPPTAREFGVTNVFDPADNVGGGVRFIRWLEDYWENRILDPVERRKFVLASYNTGHGHVEDARRLTEYAGGNDTVWSEVAYWLLQKSEPAVYRLPVVRFGFSRGYEPVTYVAIILERYDHYLQFVVEGGPDDPQLPFDPEEVEDDRPTLIDRLRRAR